MEDFVRRMNLDGYEREWSPVPSSSRADHRGVINEAGFIAFSEVAILDREAAASALRLAVDRGFDRAQEFIYGDFSKELGFLPDTSEKRESILIAGRLFNFFTKKAKPKALTIGPMFSGSGIMSHCRGDVLIKELSTLYEIKSGDRTFRSVDYRQISIYGALYFAEHRETLKHICLLNPRRGVSVEIDTQDFALQVSGQSAITFFQSIIDCFSGTLISA